MRDTSTADATSKVAVWLRTEGGESNPNRSVVVLVEIDGKWHEIIRERMDGEISHIKEDVLGVRGRLTPAPRPARRG